MLTSIVLTGAGDPITLNIAEATPNDRLIFKGADGFGPPDQDLRIGKLFADGGFYQSRRSEVRNPVLRIGIKPDFSIGEQVSTIRDELYASLLEGRVETKDVLIQTTDNVKGDRFISGYIEKFEPVFFTSEPEFQLSFICTYPYFQAEASTLLDVDDYDISIDYEGTKSIGMLIDFEALSDPSSSFELHNNTQILEINSNEEFVIGDIIRVSTVEPDFSAYLIRGEDDPINIISSIEVGSDWVKLYKGLNDIGIPDIDAHWKIKTIEYVVTDWGV